MATAVKTTITRAEWEARAIALAEQNHLTGRVRYLGQGIVDEPLYQVPSRTHDGSCHVVHLYAATGRTVCTCHAGIYGKACSHVGAAIVADKQRHEAMRTPQDEPMRSFANGMGW